MKKRFITAVCAFMLILTACDMAQPAWSETPSEPQYTHEQRLEILANTSLPMPEEFYDPELYAAYTNLFDVLSAGIAASETISDEKFTEYLSLYETLMAASSQYPRLLIQADEVKTSEYRNAQITIVDGDRITKEEITIKVRGNSTSGAPKKPYNLKFNNAISLFGMDEGKKWSLLANMYDKTLMRNKLALDFGRALGLAYTSESELVEVWMNGVYLGNYLLCEPISDGKNRVGINTEGFDFILEIAPALPLSYTTAAGVPLLYDSPETPTAEQESYLHDFLDKTEAALKTKDMSKYCRYIDVDSFVDFYLTMELFKDIDCNTTSLYFTIENGRLYAGPLWDFDLTCGNVSKTYEAKNYYTYHNINGYGDASGDSTHGLFMVNVWYEMLLADPAFAKMVRERYIELQPLVTALYQGEENCIDKLLYDHAVSFEREYRENRVGDHGAGWDVYTSYGDYCDESKGDFTDNVEFLRTWLRDRNEWLLENIGK